MGKKVKIIKKQLDEIVGVDIDYLNNDSYKEFNGNSEVSTTAKLPSSGEDGEPVSGDDFAHWRAPRGHFGVTRKSNFPIRETNFNELCKNKELQLEISKIIAKKIKEIF